jgi:hypothetical protein
MVLMSVLPARFFCNFIQQNEQYEEFGVYWDLWFKISIYLSKSSSLERSNFDSQMSGLTANGGEELSSEDKLEILRQRIKKQESDIDIIIEQNKELLDPRITIAEFAMMKLVNQEVWNARKTTQNASSKSVV